MEARLLLRLSVCGLFIAAPMFEPTAARGATPCGDVNDSGNVTASDALAVLQDAVGQNPVLVCPAISTPLQTGQTLSYGPRDDGDVQAGEPLAYVDNGDGTITDEKTGLMWEKKAGIYVYSNVADCKNENGFCQSPHSGYNTYTFAAGGPPNTAYDGTVVTIFLNQLNNRCDKDSRAPCTGDSDCAGPGGACGFAGHRDWRLPNVKELQSLVDFSVASPEASVDEALNRAKCDDADPCWNTRTLACSCTTRGGYWSATSNANAHGYAWAVDFEAGLTLTNVKYASYFARAVRGGS